MGVREWILGLVWKLQVEGGLVQCSNQGQIDWTCLRFLGLSVNCRHTYRVHTRGQKLAHRRVCARLHSHTHAHTRAHHTLSPLSHTSTHMQTEGGLHNINVQTKVNTVQRQT